MQLLRRTIDGNEAGAALADIADAGLAALLPAVAADFARASRRGAGRRFRDRRDGAARQPRDDARLRSRPDPDLRAPAIRRAAGSTGPRPLAVSTYYARLSQRLISAITAPTAEGRLYEVDMRLRPSGESGPIASSLAAFAQYQRESAWTWEHMALTRARPIAGDPALCERVAAAIADGTDPHARPATGCSPMSPICAGASPSRTRRRRPGICATAAAGWSISNSPCNTCCCARRRRGREVLHRDPAAAIAALGEAGILPPQGARELGEALSLLRQLRALLALLFDGVPDADAAGRRRAGAPWRAAPARLTSPGSKRICSPPASGCASGTSG